MLSRMADSLFWLSRYIERAENLARVLDVAQRLSTLPSAYAGSTNEWESAILSAACEHDFRRHYDAATRDNVIEFILASEANSSSICSCIETARANARAVRTTITVEMWEIINGLWNDLQRLKPKNMSPGELADFLNTVKQAALRFDGAAFRTMLRTDHFWFQRIGTYVERADNTARLLDVKYHLLLPDKEPIGGGLDYFQWAAILRAVSALTSYHHVYRTSVQPWLVADFLILRPEQPRSLLSCYMQINRFLDELAEAYGRQGPAQRQTRSTLARLQNASIEPLFQSGLHEFLDDFLASNNRLGHAISEQYLS